MKQKETFKIALAGFSIIMMLLPFLAAANSFFTNFLNHAGWYRPIQEFIVPWQARMVAVAISPFGIDSRLTPDSKLSVFYMIKNGAAIPVDLSWNCLGWQSMLLLVVSLLAGLRGRFTNISRLECMLLGFFGTLIINVFRMSLIAAGIYYINNVFSMVIHDYVAAFFTLIWLFFFWWFSYAFVLEEKRPNTKDDSKV